MCKYGLRHQCNNMRMRIVQQWHESCWWLTTKTPQNALTQSQRTNLSVQSVIVVRNFHSTSYYEHYFWLAAQIPRRLWGPNFVEWSIWKFTVFTYRILVLIVWQTSDCKSVFAHRKQCIVWWNETGWDSSRQRPLKSSGHQRSIQQLCLIYPGIFFCFPRSDTNAKKIISFIR